MSKSMPNSYKQHIIQTIVEHCKTRSAANLDILFDNGQVPYIAELGKIVCSRLDPRLDPDSVAWFCAYMSDEISGQRPDPIVLPLMALSKQLVMAGMKPFTDFTPAPGKRLLILNRKKFNKLPKPLRSQIQNFFDVKNESKLELYRHVQALLQEGRYN